MADQATTEVVVWTLRDGLYSCGVVVALASAAIAGFSAFKTGKRDLNSLGDSEIKTFEMIAKAEKDFAEFNASIVDEYDAFQLDKKNDGKEYELTKGKASLRGFYTDSVLNAYEIACQRYLDGKLDRARFSKTYAARLKKLCSNVAYKETINNKDFNFSALTKVNKQLNDPEN